MNKLRYVFTICLVFLGYSKARTVTCKGDHYEGNYNPNVWNYNYTQGHRDVPCPAACTVEAQCGPYCWQVPTAANNMCGGSKQTPINVVQAAVDNELEYPQFQVTDGGCDHWVQFADDHAFEVEFHGCSNLQLTYDGTLYTLLQFHFHAPAEHVIGGGTSDAELHMVHKSADGKLLVLGVRMDISKATNTFLDNFWFISEKYGPSSGHVAEHYYSLEYEVEHYETRLNPYTQFLPASRNFFTYSGSLTTYPCTEGVTWILFEEPIPVGEKDINNMISAVRYEEHTITYEDFNNADNRLPQPLGARTVYKYVDNGQSVATSSPSARPTKRAPSFRPTKKK